MLSLIALTSFSLASASLSMEAIWFSITLIMESDTARLLPKSAPPMMPVMPPAARSARPTGMLPSIIHRSPAVIIMLVISLMIWRENCSKDCSAAAPASSFEAHASPTAENAEDIWLATVRYESEFCRKESHSLFTACIEACQENISSPERPRSSFC